MQCLYRIGELLWDFQTEASKQNKGGGCRKAQIQWPNAASLELARSAPARP
jgi:hypothetical protein